jgi:hypothetical protein
MTTDMDPGVASVGMEEEEGDFVEFDPLQQQQQMLKTFRFDSVFV